MMTSRKLVDTQLLPLLDSTSQFNLSADTLPLARESLFRTIRSSTSPDGVTDVEHIVPGDTEVRLVLYRPDHKQPQPIFFNFHGGGYVMGGPEVYAWRNRALASAAQCIVADVHYRLAPETVFPGAIQDCYAALKWSYDNGASMGIDVKRIAIGGESAGGGLAASLALLVRDRGDIPIIHQFLVYPMLDDRTVGRPDSPQGEFVWTPADNAFGWASLLGERPGGSDVSPYAAAARAASLAGLPPAFIAVGALDLFLEENLAYALRLAQASVPTELHVYPGAFHGFINTSKPAISRAFMRDLKDALQRAFALGNRAAR
jgi:acetyl esterase/lipase